MPFLTKLGCASAATLAAASLFLPAQVAVNTVPMEVVRGKPYVMVTVNGKGPFRFIVDTGTGGRALVTSELAAELGLPHAGQARLNDPSGRGGQTAQMVLIQSLRVAGVEFTGIKAIEHALSSEDGPCYGLLGFTLFRDYLLTLDYPNREMTLASGALTPDGERFVLPIRMPDGVPIAALRIGPLRIEAQIDSGGFGLSLPEKLVPRLKLASDPVVFGNGQSLSTRFQVKAARLASDVHMGRYAFERPIVEINPAFPLANFGSAPMQNFSLTFDQKNLLLRLQSDHKVLHLNTAPTPVHMQNAPLEKQPNLALVPVG